MPKNQKIHVTSDLRPTYYDDFHCLAKECRVSCCKGWNITFNKKDYLSMKRQQGSDELNERLQHGLRRVHKGHGENTYAEFDMSSDDCPLLCGDGLCALQIEKGHNALPFVCQNFPRSKMYLPSGYLEYSLGPSCEGVLALLWAHPEGIGFVSDPIPDERQYGTFEFLEDDALTFHFQEIRSWCIDMLQDRRYPLPERILRIGFALKELADGETDIPRWLRQAEQIQGSQNLFMPQDSQTLPLFLSNNLHLLTEKVSASKDFQSLQKEIFDAFGIDENNLAKATFSSGVWLAARELFDRQFGDYAYFMENLAVAVFFHLHLPAVKSTETVWKSYVNFCNLYSLYRFMAVMSCREGSAGDRDALFCSIVHASRMMIHNSGRMNRLRDEFFEHDSATLAHMAVLLSG